MNSNIRLDTDFRTGKAREAGGWLGRARNAWETLRRGRRRRRAIAELSRMPDWRLVDLGIPRDRIAEVVDGLIAREGPEIGR